MLLQNARNKGETWDGKSQFWKGFKPRWGARMVPLKSCDDSGFRENPGQSVSPLRCLFSIFFSQVLRTRCRGSATRSGAEGRAGRCAARALGNAPATSEKKDGEKTTKGRNRPKRSTREAPFRELVASKHHKAPHLVKTHHATTHLLSNVSVCLPHAETHSSQKL